jgi:hypothetical protein
MKFEPIAVSFVDGGAEICRALESLGHVAGTCGANYLIAGLPDDVRLLAVNLADVITATKLIGDVADRLRATGHQFIADNLGPFACVGVEPNGWMLVFLAWPGKATGDAPPSIH